MFDFLCNLTKNVSRDILLFILAVDGKKPDFVFFPFEIINDANSAALSLSGNRPADLSKAARTRDNLPGIGVLVQQALQAQIFILG